MYIENAQRVQLQAVFEDYDDYLKSLEMKGCTNKSLVFTHTF